MALSINDGKATPVAHVFTQDAQQNGADPAEYVNRSNVNGPSFWERIKVWATIAIRGKGKKSRQGETDAAHPGHRRQRQSRRSRCPRCCPDAAPGPAGFQRVRDLGHAGPDGEPG